MLDDTRKERRPGIAVLSGPADHLDVVEAALLAQGFRSAPEPDLRTRQSHGLPSHPNHVIADTEGAPNAGHTPGTRHPVTGRKYKADESITFLTIPLVARPGRDRPIDDIVAAIDPGLGWRLRLHSTHSDHAVRTSDPDNQAAMLRTELYQLRKDLGLLPTIAGGAAQNPAYALQNGGGHPAELFRRAISTLIRPGGGGVDPDGSLTITQNGTPNMSVEVAGGPGFGEAWVPGTTVLGQQGLYYCYNDGALNLAVVASDPTDPRVDTVIAQVEDSVYVGASDLWQLAVLTGTPTPGATLDNLDGIAALPASSLIDGYVLVNAAATTILNADIANGLPMFGLSPGAALNVLHVNGVPGRAELGGGTNVLDEVINSGARAFVFTVPGAIAFPTACVLAWVGGYQVFSDSGHTTEVEPGLLSLRAAPNANTVQLTASNFYGFNVYPLIDVRAIGY